MSAMLTVPGDGEHVDAVGWGYVEVLAGDVDAVRSDDDKGISYAYRDKSFKQVEMACFYVRC